MSEHKLSGWEARRKVKKYSGYIDDIVHEIEKNFKDMDFENADRREQMENIIEEMITDCRSIQSVLEGMAFFD